jgi:hypothetical protein
MGLMVAWLVTFKAALLLQAHIKCKSAKDTASCNENTSKHHAGILLLV